MCHVVPRSAKWAGSWPGFLPVLGTVVSDCAFAKCDTMRRIMFRTWRFLASPLAEFIVIFRDLFYHQQLPSLGLTVCAVLWTLTSLSLGLWLFCRRLPLVVERL